MSFNEILHVPVHKHLWTFCLVVTEVDTLTATVKCYSKASTIHFHGSGIVSISLDNERMTRDIECYNTGSLFQTVDLTKLRFS
jgi:hypothetical protein